jgi:hypothetical protein
MSETKFTPGPWRSDCGCIYAECQLDEYGLTNQAPLAEVTSDQFHDDHYVENCHIIAAAPDMYAELEAAMNVFRFYQGHHAAKGHSDKEQTNKQYADRIAKVLGKARGEA